jgi:hypothetical protein
MNDVLPARGARARGERLSNNAVSIGSANSARDGPRTSSSMLTDQLDPNLYLLLSLTNGICRFPCR